MNATLLETRPAPGVVLLQLNRPDARNALNAELREELSRSVAAAERDAGTRVLVIAGSRSIFAAGADLKAIRDADPVQLMGAGLHRVWEVLSAFPKPLVMAVNGPALGAGNELAMHGDIIVAGESASFGQPEIKVGIMPGAGGITRLIRLVGRSRAMRMIMTGEPISGRQAFEWGLASEVVPDEQVLDRALEMAGKIAELPSTALASIKQVARAGTDMSLAHALDLERKSFWLLFGTRDQREGMAAFLEKRKPRFNGTDDPSLG